MPLLRKLRQKYHTKANSFDIEMTYRRTAVRPRICQPLAYEPAVLESKAAMTSFASFSDLRAGLALLRRDGDICPSGRVGQAGRRGGARAESEAIRPDPNFTDGYAAPCYYELFSTI